MTAESIPYVLLLLGSVLVASFAQVMLKMESQKKHKGFLSQYLNPMVIGAYVLMVSTTIMCVFGYKMVPLSLGVAMDALSYIFATVWGKVFFKEKATKRKILGLALIVIGVLCVGLGE